MNAGVASRRFLAGLAGTLVLAGCASTAGDRRLARGDYGGAAEAYRESAAPGWLRSQRTANASLLKLGVLLATPGTPIYDPAEARRVLERVERRTADRATAMQAALLLDRLTTDVSGRMAELEARLAEARSQRDRLAASTDPGAPGTTEADRLRDELDRMRQRAELLAEEVARLEAEIAQLKALDLDLEPGG